MPSTRVLFLGAALSSISSTLARPSIHYRRGLEPEMPYAPDTTKYCTWWIDSDGSMACEEVPDTWAITMGDFVRWVSTCSQYKSIAKPANPDIRILPSARTARGLKPESPTASRRMASLSLPARLLQQPSRPLLQLRPRLLQPALPPPLPPLGVRRAQHRPAKLPIATAGISYKREIAVMFSPRSIPV